MKVNRGAYILATVALLSLLAVSEASLFTRPRPDWSALGWPGAPKTAASVTYNATTTRLNNANPLIDSQVPKSSVFTYNYNAAVVPNAVRSRRCYTPKKCSFSPLPTQLSEHLASHTIDTNLSNTIPSDSCIQPPNSVHLLVRTQNLTAPWGPYNIGPSRLAFAYVFCMHITG